MKTKAQIAVIDLFIALFIIVIILSAVTITLNRYTSKLNEQTEYNKMQLEAFQLSDTLVKTTGTPTAWEEYPANLEIIGLASKDRILSAAKVNSFTNLIYQDARKLFKLQGCDFYFNLTRLEDKTLIANSGELPTGDYATSLQRRVLYENEEAIMEFTLWK